MVTVYLIAVIEVPDHETADLIEQDDCHIISDTGFCKLCGGVCNIVVKIYTEYAEEGLA